MMLMDELCFVHKGDSKTKFILALGDTLDMKSRKQSGINVEALADCSIWFETQGCAEAEIE
jgi:hypothetical protein